MPGLIVIQIVPQAPVDALTFRTHLAGLQVQVFDLSFTTVDTNPPGISVGTASYIADSGGWTNVGGQAEMINPPTYPANITSGIIQQVDFVPFPFPPPPGIFRLQSVAIAIIPITAPGNSGNFRVEIQQGGQTVTTIPYQYNRTFDPVATPDPATWPVFADGVFLSSWATQPVDFYVSVPAAPTTTLLQLPADGTPPAFGDLLNAVQQVVANDPGPAATVTTSAAAAAGSTTLSLTAVTGISGGMSATGGAIPAATTVVAVGPGNTVTLSQEATAAINAGTVITFAPDLATLSVAQCQNIANEIIWAQQPALPAPPDPIEDLYTNPPNSGVMLTGSSNNVPNAFEGDRQQFEGTLQSYYSVANTDAVRLTSSVYALSAAIACERLSIAATRAVLSFPATAGIAGSAPSDATAVILTGLANAGVPGNFGVPAAYFYALGATTPVQITPVQRFQRATGDQLSRLLTDLSTAINAGTVTDSESCFALPAVTASAAQAARRIAALGVAPGSALPMAPLGAVALPITAAAASGNSLTFATLTGVGAGMLVTGPGVAPGTTAQAVAGLTVTLSQPITDGMPAGTVITFTPAYTGAATAGLPTLVQDWLAFPPPAPGAPSSERYQPADDDTNFWPAAAAGHQAAFLSLVLSALTEGFVIPEPFNTALGTEITTFLASLPGATAPPTVVTLASVTAEQWAGFFQQNPTWLPPFTQPGSIAARIAAFIRAVQQLFAVGSSGPASVIVLATTGPSAGASLPFATTSGIAQGMTVTGPGIPSGTTVAAVGPGNTVTLSQAPAAPIPAQTTITFTPGFSGAVTLTTVAPGTAAGGVTLPFASTTGVVAGMTVSGPAAITPGTTVASVTAATVTLSQPTGPPGAPAGTAVTFTPVPAGSGLPLLAEPAPDWLAECLSAYGPVTFGTGLDLTRLRAAAAAVFADDQAAQEWLVDALVAIDALYQVLNAAALAPAPSPALLFSLAEALYARGFRAAADISELDGGHFAEALVGTVAYDSAAAIYAAAATIAPPLPSPVPDGGFRPVNPDGALTDCIPAPCASPLGPVAYLQEMLTVSALSRCDSVVAAPVSLVTSAAAAAGATVLPFASAAGVFPGMSATASAISADTTVTATTPTSVTLSQPLTAAAPAGTSIVFTAPALGTVLSQRRGPVGDLTASCANLETQIPLIDIVNECLEYLSAAATPASGIVYDTASDSVAGHELCADVPCPDHDKAARCHDPARLFAALPEHSTPATPGPANAAVEPAVFDKLKGNFSSCLLPYSQTLDVSRSYVRHLGSCRFEEMRTFRTCITEFVLDPLGEPAGFESWLWRYPVRIDIAIEYLGITPEEYATIFRGAEAPPCGGQPPPEARQGGGAAATGDDAATAEAAAEGRSAIGLPEFLALTCLSYCEFFELWQSGFVAFRNGADKSDGEFPQCEPCCLDDLWLELGAEQLEQDLIRLIVFIRLWRKLRDSCCFCYSFAELRDICDVLQLETGGTLNPDFVRQLAAFQMLRDHFGMELYDPDEQIAPADTGADRTHLLALWVGPSARMWRWAVRQLITRVEEHALRRHGCPQRRQGFFRRENLDPLSRLAGFDPDTATDSWHYRPTHTLRFAEVLAKIYASDFSVGELIFLLTADPHLDGDDPFPLQDDNEALDTPLALPEDDHDYALWRLRRELLDAHVPEEEHRDWPWRRIEAALRREFGFAPGDIQALGEHFFPSALSRRGYRVSPAAARFVTSLPAASTSEPMWNDPPDRPFRYDPATQELSARLPLTDRAVIRQLTHVYDLNAAEQRAVQDLFFQPRALLAKFAMLFTDFATAQRRLIEARDDDERFAYFRHQFLLFRCRSHVIARHLSRHVAAATGLQPPDDNDAAALILRSLAADENKATTSWEDDGGAMPALTWAPTPNGNALAALLGLAGTGLIGAYRPESGSIAWRDVSGPLSAFGRERNHENCPVPTVLPSPTTALTPQQLLYASVHNGFLMKDATGAWLGGAEGFSVTWSGALLVEQAGTYEFWAGAPTPEEERPDFEAAEHRRWRVVLRRGQRTWVILSHHWPGEDDHRSAPLPLRRGAYDLRVEFVQPAPEFSDDEQVRPQRTGFQVKYRGPDTEGHRTEIPHQRLFVRYKDETLADGITGLTPGAAAYLDTLYVSSLRDIRRTYQRAFKALLFTHRFGLSGRRQPHGTSELGYMLQQAARFAGSGYYRSGAGFRRHAADFRFDFLPVRDHYHVPTPAQDARTAPSPQRIQAMLDWWERAFDYTRARAEVRRRCGRHLWHLFKEAEERQPPDPASLLRHMCADERHWRLDLRYFQDQHAPVYSVTSADLQDDRWTLRAWHADRWLSTVRCCFAVRDITAARPDLWASDDPSAALPEETETGNANLLAIVGDGCLENGKPRRYDDLRRLNNGLRERGRTALIAYLCHGNRVALPWQPGQFATTARDLSDLLLLDVEAGIREKASRIDEAISAAQTYVRRARLGLEPGWTVTPPFARLWDRQFATLRIWQECKRRQLYRENWIEWEDLEEAQRIEAFRFLSDKLRDAQLTVAAPGGLDWWPDQRPPWHNGLELLQRAEASGLQRVTGPSGTQPREGLNLLGTPERDARPSWLARLADPSGPPVVTGRSSPGTPKLADAERAAETSTGMASAAAADEGAGAGTPDAADLPYWLKTAIRLGTRFWRIDAAGLPPAGNRLAPYPHRGPEDCVTCCEECGCGHPAVIDQYYFWLVDGQFYEPPVTPTPTGFSPPPPGTYQYGYQQDFYDAGQQEAALWQDPAQLPQLLQWQGSPMVRLAWCRVHNGVFQQPRRSVFGVAISDDDADLTFLGRTADSLSFSVTSGVAPEGVADPAPPGFRYDIATDSAIVLPQVAAPPPPPHFLGNRLPAYPYFVFFRPGTELFPLGPFAPALAVASALRLRCRFEAALGWYRIAFDPLRQDCIWVNCDEDRRTSPGAGENQPPDGPSAVAMSGQQDVGGPEAAAPASAGRQPRAREPEHTSRDPLGACCDSTDISCEQARDRAVLLHYLETLVEWGDAVRCHRDSPEAFEQARVIFAAARTILGDRPRAVRLQPPASPPTVTNFVPEFAPLNPRLLGIYDVVEDRLDLIHAVINARRLRESRPNRAIPYFDNDPLREGWRTEIDICADERDWCHPPCPYRFTFLIQKALDYAARAEQLGNALLAAFEKGDAEFLATLRAGQELELLALALEARKDQWRDADWQVQALQTGKSVTQANLTYTTSLINSGPGGLIDGEIQYQQNTSTALQLRGTANIIEGVGEALRLIPDLVLGAAGFGGTPVSISWIPLGTKIGGALEAVARIINNSAEIDSITAGLDQTSASWLRRLIEWQHEAQVQTIEIHQAERQILGAQRRRDQALADLNSQQRQIENSEEVKNFLRDKFTAHDLYLYLQNETLALYRTTYELALHAARQAQQAFNLERGHTTRRFIPECDWEDLREGLLAGERLSAALHHMDKTYMDENVREYELTKTFSLRMHFPIEFLQLRATGRCEIYMPEWMFDLDAPGMYLRRIKNVALTIPAVAGPYTGVHCKLTLLGSVTRIDPMLQPPAHGCCCPPEPCPGDCRDAERRAREYELCPDDPRAVRQYDARQAIATSSGQNDTGLFQLSFEDPRYLPFEYMGAVSRWRIELPAENNYFPLDTVSDLIITLNYAAREGGELLRQAANDSAQRHLPGDGWRFLDIRQEFPDAWQPFRTSRPGASEDEDEEREKPLRLQFTRQMFPFVPGGRDVWIDKIAIVFGTSGGRPCRCPDSSDCPCPMVHQPAESEIDYVPSRDDDDRDKRSEREDKDDRVGTDVRCFAGVVCPGLYCGIIDTRLGPVGEDGHGSWFELRLPAGADRNEHMFLLCRYRVHPEPRGCLR
jgi:receptor-binding and translocation channel-forming TcA subunit of Tc toxin/ABC toxin-like protein